VRSVVPVRLSDLERSQIAGAAARLELPLSSFIRQASLLASARVERKVSVAVPEPEPVILDTEPKREHWVDGERVF
jgi:hypothetical protein